ncbi:MAG: 5'/3'-nucleotidase SurE [Christensenellales bacterium]
MRILISNDDGIMAPGIRALAKRLSKEHEVTVVAPSKEQSGVGHSITYFTPIYSRPQSILGVDVKAFAVDGSPVDCVKFGIGCIMEEKPDLVVTGINQGPNIGPDVFPSGTVNAAIAGVLEGVPAIAVSYADFLSSDFEASAELAARLVNFVKENPLPKGMLLNLNVPALPLEEIKGPCVVPIEEKGLQFRYETRESPMKRSYHWLTIVGGRENVNQSEAPVSDADAIAKGYASITPVKIDLSDYDYIEKLKQTGRFI